MTTSSIAIVDEQLDEDADAFTENEQAQDPPSKAEPNNAAAAEMGMLISTTDDAKDSIGGEMSFPESTHSFLFTHPVKSVPFVFALIIAVVSYVCLIIALIDNIKHNEIPVNVDTSVRAAQYMAIAIALLMEEEIPTGLYYLRKITKPKLQSKFPEICYRKFVASCILRFSMGYLFLANVIVILAQADNVLEIFYDCLALVFLQQLDDIAFSVSKIEVLGKQMEHATKTPYFTTTFEGRKDRLGISRKIRVFLKAVYLVNLFLFLGIMSVVSIRQTRGVYHCDTYNLRIGGGHEIWPESYVHNPEDSRSPAAGVVTTTFLDFSNFNGLYRLDHSRSSEGRPIYIEQNKADRKPFDNWVPEVDITVFPYFQPDPIKPAEIRYCGGRWMLVHDYIRKTKDKADDSSSCGSWLLRSEPYDGFDLGSATGWQVWEGEIVSTDVLLTCNKCEDNADCNLNGICNNGKCKCNNKDGELYMGENCEVKLKDECHNIIARDSNGSEVVFSVDKLSSTWPWLGEGVFQGYSRPVYSYVEGLSPELAPKEDSMSFLYFSGSRFVVKNLPDAKNNSTFIFFEWAIRNYHGLWSGSFEPGKTFLISNPTESDSPVGVDFFFIGEQDDQFGPFGELIPAREPVRQGFFRCDAAEQTCQFCRNGITADPDLVVDQFGTTCSGAVGWAALLKWKKETAESYGTCLFVRKSQELCCPEEWSNEVN